MVDKVHQRPDGTAGRTFRENRERFLDGEDFIEVTSDEIRRQSLRAVFPARTPKGVLLTRRGSEDARRFIDALDLMEPGNSGVQAKRGGRGVGGVTFAHWQIAMAFAKYLSPEFHMSCNTVVRERMEGKSISTASLPADVLDLSTWEIPMMIGRGGAATNASIGRA